MNPFVHERHITSVHTGADEVGGGCVVCVLRCTAQWTTGAGNVSGTPRRRLGQVSRCYKMCKGSVCEPRTRVAGACLESRRQRDGPRGDTVTHTLCACTHTHTRRHQGHVCTGYASIMTKVH